MDSEKKEATKPVTEGQLNDWKKSDVETKGTVQKDESLPKPQMHQQVREYDYEGEALKKMTLEELAEEAQKKVYQAVAQIFETAEHRNLIVGQGHHMAQKFGLEAKLFLLERKIKDDKTKK